MKLQDCVIASAAATAELTPCINAGIATMIVTTGDQSGAPAQATNQAIYNSGVRHIAIDVSAHSSTSVVATYQAMGFRVWGYTVKRQYDADLWLNAGIDALYSDDPLYTNGVTSKYRQTTDDFQTGVFPSGMIPADDGTLNRGTLQYGRWFPKPGKAVSLLGQFSPVPSASNLTFDFTVCIDTVGSDTSRHPDVVCSTDDRYYDAATPRSVNTGYIGFIRLTGAMFLFRTVAGVNTQIGTTSSTATVAPIVLSAGLASGVAITSLSVNALPADVPSGTQFMLPTEQLVTTSALASSGATSISINSVTPSAAVANGTSIPQAIRMRYQQTSTNVILTRLDTSTTLSVADATHRGTYLHAGQNDSAGASGMQTSFCDITVS